MQCLKTACNSIYQKAQYVQLILFPPTYFDLLIAYGGESKIMLIFSSFLGGGGGDRELLFIELNRGTHTK